MKKIIENINGLHKQTTIITFKNKRAATFRQITEIFRNNSPSL